MHDLPFEFKEERLTRKLELADQLSGAGVSACQPVLPRLQKAFASQPQRATCNRGTPHDHG
jgi:hypothetical protein